MAEDNLSGLFQGMILVGEDHRKRVIEYAASFVEADSMFLKVGLGLVCGPFEYQRHPCTPSSYRGLGAQAAVQRYNLSHAYFDTARVTGCIRLGAFGGCLTVGRGA